MVVESNPIVVRLDIVVAAAKEERTKVRARWKLQTEVHCGYHVPLCDPDCHGSENGCRGGGCHAEKCLQQVSVDWCAWQHESLCLPS